MFSFFRYKKNGLPYGLIKLHEFLLEDIILYFERGKFVRKRVKKACKAVKQAIRFARKKKTYPSKKTDLATKLMEELYDEVDYAHKVLKEAAFEMESMITQIKEERVTDIATLITAARECFMNKEIDNGVENLKKAQNQLEKKFLLKTRKILLSGTDREIKTLKNDIEKKLK